MQLKIDLSGSYWYWIGFTAFG